MRVEKTEIDRRVAISLGMNRETVSKITRLFLDQIVESLVGGDEVRLIHFGAFDTTRMTRPEHSPGLYAKKGHEYIPYPMPEESVRVTFRKAQSMKKRFARVIEAELERKANGQVRSG